MWKETVMTFLRDYPGTCLEKLRKTKIALSQNNRHLDWNLNVNFPEREDEAVPP
jgi:hypothetical protein